MFAIKGTAALLYGQGAAAQCPTELWTLLQSYLAQMQAIVDAAGRQAATLRAQAVQQPDEWLERAMALAHLYANFAKMKRDPASVEEAAEALRAHLSARLLPPQGWQMVRDALAELVEVKDIKERAAGLHFAGPSGPLGEGWKDEWNRLQREYIERQPKAWTAARTALAAAPSKEK